MKHGKTVLGAGIVFLFGIFICFPLFGKGYIPTHDGEYHIIRYIEFFRMLTAGYWFPRWSPTINSGYGMPIFLFHYPFPNYIGALCMSIGVDAVEAFKLSLALGFMGSGICSFLWLKKLFGVKAAVTGSLVSAFVPYWFVDIYVRGSVGEVWALSFVFASLLFLEYKMPILFSFAIAALILSHNILAMIFMPFLLGYSLLQNRSYLKGIFFGIILSSYFWIPALLERGYVVGLNIVNFHEHFVELYEFLIPSWGTGFSGAVFGVNKMSFQIGIIPLAIIVGSIIIVWKEKNMSMKHLYWYYIIFVLCSIAVMFSWSSSLWEHIAFLSFVQFPWRFLSVIIPVTAFIAAYISHGTRMRIWSIILIGVSVFASYSYIRPHIYEPRDEQYYASMSNFTDGTSSIANTFSTIWTGWKTERPQYILEVINGQVPGGLLENFYLRKTFSIISETGSEVYVPVLYYPGWKVFIDRKEVPIDYRTDGTIKFDVSPGMHTVRVVFTETPVRILSNILSILTLVWLLGWGILRVYAHRNRHASSSQ
jgi:hypothetical protein